MTDVPNLPPPGTTPTTTSADIVEDHSRSRATIGIILLVLGGLFFLDRLGFEWRWHWHPTFDRLWPVLLIVAGLTRVLDGPRTRTVTITKADGTRTSYQRDRSSGGLWLLILGVIFLCHQNGWLTLDQSWPLFIIAAGVSILLGSGWRCRTRREL